MEGLNFYTVSVPLQKDGDLMQRIQASADARKISFDAALSEAVNIGLWKHIERNIDMVDRLQAHIGTL